MNCNQYRELLSAYVDDQLSQPESMTLMDHLSGCRSCRDEMASLLAVKDAFSGGLVFRDEPAPSPMFVARVMDGISTLPDTQPSPAAHEVSEPVAFRFFPAIREFFTLRPALAGAAALAGILVASGSFYLSTSLREPALQKVSDVKARFVTTTAATADDALYSHARLEAANTVDGLSFATHHARGESF